MEATVQARPQKSTTVRSSSMQLELVRAGLKWSSVVAPNMTDRITAKMFFHPRRPPNPRVPKVDGITAEQHTIASSFGMLAAWTWGQGPTILFAHGWEGGAWQFAPFVPRLVADGFRVAVFDMPAHGKSSGTQVTVVDMAQAIREVAEDLMPFIGKERQPLHAVVGHSLGGAAASLAVVDGLAAERVVLLAPAAEPTFFARRAAKFMQLSPERTEGMLRGIRDIVGREFDTVDLRKATIGLAVPVLILHDEDDDDVPFHHGAQIAAAWPGSQLVTVHGLGHRRILKDESIITRVAQFVAPCADSEHPYN